MSMIQKQQPGCENSLRPAASRRARLTSDPLPTFSQMSLPLFDSITSSRALADGPLPSDLPACPTMPVSQPAPVLVNHSAAPDCSSEQPTLATSGPISSGSSASAGFQSRLESRLRASLDVNGSPEYVL